MFYGQHYSLIPVQSIPGLSALPLDFIFHFAWIKFPLEEILISEEKILISEEKNVPGNFSVPLTLSHLKNE